MSLLRKILFSALLCLIMPEAVLADHQVVLVASAKSPVHELDSLQVRKIYLGFPVSYKGNVISGLLNTGDVGLRHIFYQNVAAMSEKSYTHRILSLMLQKGTPRPPEYDSIEALNKAIQSNPYSVTYMWKEDAERLSDIKILSVLWQKN